MISDETVVEVPRNLNVLTAFEDICDMLKELAMFRSDLSYEAIKTGKFNVSFYRWVNPFAKPEGETSGREERYKVRIDTENIPIRIDTSPFKYKGSWEGVEHGIKEDIAYLKSLGFGDIVFLGYHGDCL